MAAAPFPIHPEYTAIAIAYRNRRLIADEVLPRVPVGKQEFRFLRHALGDGFTIPDTRVGRRSSPTEVSFSATEEPGFTEDFGLDDPVPQADIDNAPPNYDPLARATEGLTDLILLDREKRVADLVFNAASYPVGNKSQVQAGDRFDADTSKPIKAIMDVLDGMVMRPTIGVFGRAAFSALARHPDIVKATHGNSGDSGIARREAIAELFELEDILVGESFLNTTKKGKTPTLARVWGKHAAFLHRDQLADTRKATFGFSAQWGTRIAGSETDSKIGLRGGQRVRVGESMREVIAAPDLGYFLEGVVS